MIDLEGLTKEERTLITIQCESFFLSYTEVKAFNMIHKELLPYCKRVNAKELWLFIAACAKALKYGNGGSQFSLRSQDYTDASKVAKKVSWRRSLKVITIMEEQGFITMYKGFFDMATDTSIKSCFIMEDKLHQLFEGVNVEKFGTKRDPMSMVEIRDSETKEQITELSKLRGIKNVRDLVERFNHNLQKHDIRIKGRKAVTVFKRIYANDLSGAGRWYSFNSLQTASKTLRPFITIGGEKCTEVDFCQIHPRLLYTLEEISKPKHFEPYSVVKGVVIGEAKAARRFLKMALMCLLYAKSEKAAMSALRKKLDDDSKKEVDLQVYHTVKVGMGGYKRIFVELRKTNAEIEHWFYKKDLWTLLQHYDSTILAEILERGIEDNVPMLPWHDSVVVTRSNQEYLITTMKDAWYKVMGTDINCFYTIEF